MGVIVRIRIGNGLRWTTAATLLAVIAGGCSTQSPTHQHPGGSAAATSSSSSTAPQTQTQTPAATTPTAPGPVTPTGTPAPGKLRPGDHGPAVLALQQRLTALGYWLGTPDGRFGDVTEQAVFALQKAAGLSRDGIVGARTRSALDAGKRPHITTTGVGHRIEINKTSQLLLIIDGSTITTILNTSTGSGRTFVENGRHEVALTPSGRFRIDRQIDGQRIGPLGALWRPKYFNGGIAIHGIDSVPPYPASHGCARLSNAAIDWIWDTNQAPIGTSVVVD